MVFILSKTCNNVGSKHTWIWRIKVWRKQKVCHILRNLYEKNWAKRKVPTLVIPPPSKGDLCPIMSERSIIGKREKEEKGRAFKRKNASQMSVLANFIFKCNSKKIMFLVSSSSLLFTYFLYFLSVYAVLFCTCLLYTSPSPRDS